MRRREFITLLGGAAAWPLAARAQQPKPVIGFLTNGLMPEQRRINAFNAGLKENGFVDGQNVAVEYRWAENQNERLSSLASDLVRRHVDVIVAMPTPAALAARTATTTIPIVFSVGVDPVSVGLVDSLNHPGGNATGVSYLTEALVRKRLELLHELIPTATTIAVLVNPANPKITESTLKEAKIGAAALGLQVLILNASTEREIDVAFNEARQQHVSALLVGADTLFSTYSDKVVALALRNVIPAIYEYRDFVEAGGLMSYGANIISNYEYLGRYASRILKGEKPSELPTQQIVNVDLVLNLKTAKVLGLAFPLPLLGRADEVIE